ncbi:septum site-determining protein Ssd [Streptomyces sp. NPDC000594]|uniref:septum site-determining protein Ssd n=1 Tax=Streptomyces sp. NPDC000594 TaxID=3154261 RepID=UPI003323F271
MAGSLRSKGTPVAGERRPVPLILTEDMELLDDLLRLCAAAGTEPEVHHTVPERRSVWEAAPLILVGDDVAGRCRGVSRRHGVLLVGREQDDPEVWRLAVEIGADGVVRLPDAERFLVDRIADAVEGVGAPATTVGIIGGCGGAGASTLACALAVTAAREGHRTLLIDGDPLGGGIDVALGGERAEGRRWPDFASAKGRVAGGALEESLPELHRLRVLSWDRGDTVTVPPEALRAVLAAGRRRGGVVVVDLPRRVDEAVVEALAQLDLGLLVVPGGLRPVAAASRVASVVDMVLRDLRVVARGPYTSGLDDGWVAASLGLPLAGEMPWDPGAPSETPDDCPPGRAGTPLARFCATFWERALMPGAPS